MTILQEINLKLSIQGKSIGVQNLFLLKDWFLCFSCIVEKYHYKSHLHAKGLIEQQAQKPAKYCFSHSGGTVRAKGIPDPIIFTRKKSGVLYK